MITFLCTATFLCSPVMNKRSSMQACPKMLVNDLINYKIFMHGRGFFANVKFHHDIYDGIIKFHAQGVNNNNNNNPEILINFVKTNLSKCSNHRHIYIHNSSP